MTSKQGMVYMNQKKNKLGILKYCEDMEPEI